MKMQPGETRQSPAAWEVQWRRRLAAGRARLEKGLRYLVATRADWLRHKLGAGFNPPLRVGGTRRLPRFFFLPREVPAICSIWRQRLADEAASTVGQAERICQHRFDLLGYKDVACGAEIDWHCDHVHGSQAPLRPWFKLLRLLNQADPARPGDCRIVWELNRHQHLVTLAKAYRLSGNRKFAAEVFTQWEHWHRHNPYPLGLNWMSTREIALRGLSWLWVYFLLVNTPELPRGFRAEWLRALYLSGRHIERYAQLHEPPEDNFLAEGVLLFFVGVLCPELEPAEDWKKRGWEIVQSDAARLAHGEEVRFEASTWQQVHRVDLLLHASILATANDVLLPPALEIIVEKMLEVLCLLGRAGAPPKLGPEDGGRVFDAQRNRPDDTLDPLATGSVLFGRGDFKAVAGELREEMLWLLGEPGIQAFDHLEKKTPLPESVALPAAGLYLSANPAQHQQLVIDARSTPVPKCHDRGALALSINQAGQALILDPGIVATVVPGERREHQESTSLNNTLFVDWGGLQPTNRRNMESGSPAVGVDAWISGKSFDLFAGSHRRGWDEKNYLLHRRWVFSLHSEFWLVRDVALGEGVHRVGVFWHLNPEALQHSGPSGMCVEGNGANGLRVLTADDHGWSQEVRQGFWSPVYGASEPLNLLQFSTTTELPAEFVTLLTPAGKSSAESRLSAIEPSTIEPSTVPLHVRAYRYGVDGDEHNLLFGDGQEWSLSRWKSDAEFLYWGQSRDRSRRVLICCNASYVESEGRRVVSCSEQIQRCELVISGEQMDVYCSDPDAKVSKRALDGPFGYTGAESLPEIPAQKRLRKAAGQ